MGMATGAPSTTSATPRYRYSEPLAPRSERRAEDRATLGMSKFEAMRRGIIDANGNPKRIDEVQD